MKRLQAETNRRLPSFIGGTLMMMVGFCLLLTFCEGCQKHAGSGAPDIIKVAYLGLTCEAPIFVAHEKGFFKEQGIEVELVLTDWDGLREGLANGQFHANHTLVMYSLKGIEKNSDIKITAGVHTGCLRLQVDSRSEVKSVSELRGKRIGVPTHIGSPPSMFSSRVLASAGIDPSLEAKQIAWIPFPPDQLGRAIEDGQVDAVATADPIGTILEGKKIVRTIADQAKDLPYSEEYCCAVVVNGEFARQYPSSAAKVTKAILKGAKWVEENAKVAAEMGVKGKYIAGSAEMNAQVLSMLKYTPGVARGKQTVEQAALDMKKAKLLNESTDPAALAQRAWLDLEGVTDEWVGAQVVERLEGGRPVLLNANQFAALFGRRTNGCACCGPSE